MPYLVASFLGALLKVIVIRSSLQCVDFWVPYEIGRNYVETVSHGALRCKSGRGEHSCRRALC